MDPASIRADERRIPERDRCVLEWKGRLEIDRLTHADRVLETGSISEKNNSRIRGVGHRQQHQRTDKGTGWLHYIRSQANIDAALRIVSAAFLGQDEHESDQLPIDATFQRDISTSRTRHDCVANFSDKFVTIS